MSALLEARGLVKAWDGRRVLDGLDLTLRAGEHLLIHGPSGSGKSTLLALLGRLAAPDAGTILLDGQPIEDLGDPAAFRRNHIGFIFQDVLLIDSLTVFQNVDIVHRSRGRRGPDPRTLLAPLGLAERARDKAAVLSRGERQRVALARAFAGAPRLVLADEPTASLDAGSRDQTLDQLFMLAETVGATAVVVSHDEALRRRPELRTCRALVGGQLHERA